MFKIGDKVVRRKNLDKFYNESWERVGGKYDTPVTITHVESNCLRFSEVLEWWDADKFEFYVEPKPIAVESWPKYYVNVNRPRNWAIVRYNEKPAIFIEHEVSRLFEWNHDMYVCSGIYKEVAKEDIIKIFDKNPFQEEVVIKNSKPVIPFSGAGQYRLRNGQIVNLNAERLPQAKDNIKKYNGHPINWGWYSSGTIRGLGFEDHSHLDLVEKLGVDEEKIIGTAIAAQSSNTLTKGKSYDIYDDGLTDMHKSKGILIKDDAGNKQYYECSKFDAAIINNQPVMPNTSVSGDVFVMKEEEVMKRETAIKVVTTVAKTAASLGFKALNYWLFEPATNLGRPIVKSVRYAVFVSTLAGLGYAYNNPESAKDLVKSCIPKISVSVEGPEILR